jgi:energy-coupling factor transporter ATP-binding protein EcfA2
MIYLDVDKDYRPLIIDQPEENLDNRSVYSTLVEYFRSAKGKRQIILVTHNANLVVNADADQVVVANFDLDRSRQTTVIEYVAGSLEFAKKKDGTDPSALTCQGIRVHVCEILEGGDEAFKRRESKYGFGTR